MKKVYYHARKIKEWSIYKKIIDKRGKNSWEYWEGFKSERAAKKAYEDPQKYDCDPNFRIVMTVHYQEKLLQPNRKS